MYCHICGEELPDRANVCPECGIRVPETRENRVKKAAVPVSKPIAPKVEIRTPVPSDFHLKWYYFLIYGFLFVNAASLFISSLVYWINFSDLAWIGVLTIFLGIYALVARFSLAKFKASAPGQLLGFFIASYGTGIMSNIIQYAKLPDWIKETTVGSFYIITITVSIILAVIMVWSNHVYFKNREELFVN